jgi:hypothetical protein
MPGAQISLLRCGIPREMRDHPPLLSPDRSEESRRDDMKLAQHAVLGKIRKPVKSRRDD